MDNHVKEDEIEKMAKIFADKELPWSWPKSKDGEDMAQRVGQAPPFSKKHKGQQNNMIKAFKAGYAAATLVDRFDEGFAEGYKANREGTKINVGRTHRFKNEQEFLKFLKWQQKEQTTPAKELEGKEEIARQYAENRMGAGWDRDSVMYVGIFYGYYIEKLKELLATTQPKSNEAIEFAEWIKNNWSFSNGSYSPLNINDYCVDDLNIEQLYNLFSRGGGSLHWMK